MNFRGWRQSLLRVFAVLAGMTGVSIAVAEDKVFISEFMAANVRTLADRDRDYSDWIELHNAGSAAANLEGWFLTNERSNLKKWRFPAATIGANEYLVVFASKKDRRTISTDLHTNFKLDAERGYLALVKPDGVTVASDFGREYPQQVAHSSYGLEMVDRVGALVSAEASKRVLVPTGDIGLKWTAAEFDDRSWLAGTKGIGFDGEGKYGGLIGTDLRERMAERNTSAYLRTAFNIEDPALDTLKLRMRYDDGFIAYLNGREVLRRNAPAKAQWNSAATASHGAGAPAVFDEPFGSATGSYVVSQVDVQTKPKVVLTEGTDRGYLRLVNGRLSNQVNSVTFPQAAPGPFEAMSAEFDFRWKAVGDGTQRLVFLLLPVAQYGANGEGIGLGTFRDTKDPKFPGVLGVQLLHSPEDGKKALTVHWDRVKKATVDLPNNALGQRIFHRAQVLLKQTPQGGLLTVNLISDVNGPRKQTLTPVSQLLIAEMRPFQPRVQIAGRIGHWDQTIDLDGVRSEFNSTGQTSAEEFDLSDHVNALRPGQNILAIQGLNHSTNGKSFFVLPELWGGYSAIKSKQLRYFATPTPRTANREGFAALSPPPVFSKRSGVYTEPVSLQLSARSGVVRYTVDGSEPNASSPEYSAPLALNASTLVKARTFAPDSVPSAIVTETFTFADETALNIVSPLPIVILNPFGQYLSANGRATVSIRLINTVKGQATVLGPADFDGRASVNVRGFSTLRQPKNSLTIRLKDENDDRVDAGLFGLPKESDWVLYAPYADKTLIRDVLAYELSNHMGRYAPRTRLVEVFIDRSGGKLGQRDYMGVYVLVERIKRDKNRVNVKELTASQTTEPEISGGYIFKRDHSERSEPSFGTGQGNRFYYVEPKPEDMSREQMRWIANYMNRFEQALYGSDFRDPGKGYAAYLDVDAFIDQHWLIEMSKNIDGFRYSAYLYKDRGGKIQAGPAWDWNLSFGNADYYDGSDPTGWYTSVLRDTEICWFRRLSEDPEFMQRTVDRWGELRRKVLATSTILSRIDELAALLESPQTRNFRRWPIMGRRVNPNDFVGNSYAEEIKWMKQWIQRRLTWIDSQFPTPPSLAEANGAVTLRAGSGKILFTLDGSDPRLPGGGVSPKAQTYGAPIPLNKAGNLFARVQQRNSWSSPTMSSRQAGDRARRSE